MTATYPDDFKTVLIFQMTANFYWDYFETVRIFPDGCQFSGWFQSCPDFPDDYQFSGWFGNCPKFSRWLPIFWMISKVSRFFQMQPSISNHLFMNLEMTYAVLRYARPCWIKTALRANACRRWLKSRTGVKLSSSVPWIFFSSKNALWAFLHSQTGMSGIFQFVKVVPSITSSAIFNVLSGSSHFFSFGWNQFHT